MGTEYSPSCIQNGSRAFFAIIMIILCIVNSLDCFEIEGSQMSYVKYPVWFPCQNGSISFEFKSIQPNGLLFYQDDGGKFDFFELKLVGGRLKLRLNLGEGAIFITCIENVNDGQWHKVELKRNQDETTLIVDDIVQTRASRGSEFNFGNASKNSFVYLGGLPIEFTAKLTSLALPSVMFEPRFRGSFRNLFYSNCGRQAVRVEMLESVGVRSNGLDLCSELNPCMNHGICISTDNGLLCDCRDTNYDGQHCEEEKVASEATFYGREYLSYDLSHNGDVIVGSNDQISLYFKTRQASGLLFYTGDGGDYIAVSLTEGGITVGINLGSGVFETEVKPRKGHIRFDDNRWHKVVVTRESREVTVQIDEAFKRTGTTVGDFTMLSSKELYIGGSSKLSQKNGFTFTDNFRGCLKEVIYKADSINLDIVNLAQSNHDLINQHGQITYRQCKDQPGSQPITFITEESFITAPSWDAAKGGKIAFQFRTSELNGLLMYNFGPQAASDFFAFELLEGVLYLILDMGSGPLKLQASQHSVSDGLHHRVVLDHRGRTGTVEVDGQEVNYRTVGSSRELDLAGHLYIGGINTFDGAKKIPRILYSAMLKYGYVGCMQDLEVNKKKYNLAQLASEQRIEGIYDYCRVAEPQCISQPCHHRGACHEGWNRFVCDCAATSYIGATCKELATTLSFDGTEFMKITLPEESTTQAEDITLRFQTQRPNGLLFASTSSTTSDRLELMLEDGQVRFDVSLGSGSKSLYAGQDLADDLWHTVYLKRRAQDVELKVDNSTKTKEKMYGDSETVEFDSVNIGKKPKRDAEDLESEENFVGHMQQFVFNGNHFFEMARTGEIKNIETTAKFDKQDKLVNFPITFKSPAAYLTTKLRLYSTFSIHFQLKTTQADGLIMYSAGGGGKDFMAIELVNGHIRYIFDVGSGPRVVRADVEEEVNDNAWHSVAILRPGLNQHIVKVDDSAQFDNLPDSRSVHFDTSDRFFVGGIDKTMYNALPKQVKSREGFQGCLASLDLDGDNRSLLQHRADIPDEYRDDITEGCAGPATECSVTACKNNGLCLQEWNSFNCDCDMTSFTGPTCEDDGIAYTFGAGGGLITFEFPPHQRPDTKRDQIALGFITDQRDAILLRIDSGNSNDYIEMELVDGNIFVVYNMGTMDHPIGELFEAVNDNNYHVVRYTRAGPNSTIQVDSLPVQPKHPTGRQLSIFNNQARIYIGGKKDQSGRQKRPFDGTIAGLVVNGIKVLELAAEGDERVSIEGDVELEIKPLKQHISPTPLPPTRPVIVTPIPGETSTSGMQSTMGVNTTPRGDGLTDDLVFSGGSSGCQYEDEEECSHAGSGATDAFISPIAKVITTPSTTRRSWVTPTPTSTISEPVPISEASGEGPCFTDDEDCEGGSGSGFVVDPVNTPKTSTDDIIYETPESPHIPVDPEKPQSTPASHQVKSSTTSTTDSIIFTVNMTETPPKSTVPSLTTRRTSYPHEEETPPTNNGQGGKGSASGPSASGPGNGIKHEETKDGNFSRNIGLIVGIAAGIILLIFILAYALYKFKSRDEGSYKIDESKNYSYDTCNTKPPPHVNGGMAKSGSTPSKPKKKDVKEWYV